MMRTVAWISMIVVLFACFVVCDGETTSAPVKSNSKLMVDLTLMVDLAVRYGPDRGQLPESEESRGSAQLSSWIAGLFSNWNKAEFQELHLAIVDATIPDQLKLGVDLGWQGLRAPPDLASDSSFIQRSFVNKEFISSVPPVDVKKMVENVNKTVYNSMEGDRPHVPNVIAYIGTTKYQPNVLDGTVEETIHLFNGADIVVLSDGWAKGRRTAIAYKNSDGNLSAPIFHEVDTPESKEAFKTAVQKLLARCPTYNTTNGTCYYRDQSQTCKRPVYYKGSLVDPKDEAGEKYCVNDTNHEVCGNDGKECKDTCNKFMGWSECFCENRTKSREKTVDPLIEYCQGYDLTVTACPPTCPTTTDKEEGFYEIAVPVWAILMFTFLIVVILTVIVTLFIYFTIFPPPYDSEKESVRTDRWHHRWHQRVHGGVRSMYRRGGGTGGTERSTVRTDRTDRSNIDRFAKTRNNDRSDYRR